MFAKDQNEITHTILDSISKKEVPLESYAISLRVDEVFSGSEFMAYIILFARLLTPVKAFSTAYAIVLKGAASADRLEEVLQAKNDITDASKPKKVTFFS